MTKILVVEDDKSMNGFVSSYLRDSGYDVKSCYNGKEALSLLEQEKFSLIISDIMMPIMDGFELAENVRATDKTTPIIFMSAKDDKPSKLYGYKIRIDDYVTKPFDIDVLIMKIAVLLRRAQIETDRKLTVGNFTMNAEERTAVVDGEEISLTVRAGLSGRKISVCTMDMHWIIIVRNYILRSSSRNTCSSSSASSGAH